MTVTYASSSTQHNLPFSPFESIFHVYLPMTCKKYPIPSDRVALGFE